MRYLTCLFCFLFITAQSQQKDLANGAIGDTSRISNMQELPYSEHHHQSNQIALPPTSNQSGIDASIYYLYNAIGLSESNLSYDVFRYGMIGYYALQQKGKLNSKELLSIIDFTKPSSKKRLYVIDLEKRNLMYHTYVSHGKNTGEDMAKEFSNVPNSNQSSLGFYITAETYVGSKGYSLKLDGIEKGYNDKLRDRAVVMHEADYVSENWIKRNGRLGRSQGCPALPVDISKQVINTIKDHTLIFAYYNDVDYLRSSAYLNIDNLLNEDKLAQAFNYHSGH